MSVDNPDKTVFRQPINRGDGTVIRPMPGGRAPSNQPAPPAQQAYQPQQPQQAQPMSMPREVTPGNFSTSTGLNPLVNAASTLLAVFSKTRESLSHPNVASLHQQLEREIKSFDNKARSAGVKEDTVMIARYLLCTILDEAVLNTPWGAESAWNQRTLLGTFHKETAGGEKFFAILDRLRNTPADNIEVLELIYICLSLGYEGKYRVVARGRDQLEQLRDDLFYIIRSFRGEYERSLSPCWQGLAHSKNTLSKYVPMWVVASVFVGLMALTYSGFRYWLDQSSTPVSHQLTEIKTNNNQAEKDAKPSNSSANKTL